MTKFIRLFFLLIFFYFVVIHKLFAQVPKIKYVTLPNEEVQYQITKYVCKNSNGIIETLQITNACLADCWTKEVIYRSSNAQESINLNFKTILTKNDEYLEVSFPYDYQVYRLRVITYGVKLSCIDEKGNVQVFEATE